MTVAADTLTWDKMGGLLPAIVQDALSGAVLMLGLVFDPRYRSFPSAALLLPALFYLCRPVALARREAGLLAALIAAGIPLQLYQEGLRNQQALGWAQRFADCDVRWFEEPVSSDDLEGLHQVRQHGPAGMDIAAQEGSTVSACWDGKAVFTGKLADLTAMELDVLFAVLGSLQTLFGIAQAEEGDGGDAGYTAGVPRLPLA